MSTGMSNAGESDLLKLLFQNTNFPNAPVIQGSSTAGSYYAALHTSTGPGQAGTQSTNEAAYPGYGRVAIARTSGAWTITGSNPTTAENAAAVTFPAATGGSETENYASLRDRCADGQPPVTEGRVDDAQPDHDEHGAPHHH